MIPFYFRKMDSKLSFRPFSFNLIITFLIICSSTLPFFPSLHGDLVFDDLPAIAKNPDLVSISSTFYSSLFHTKVLFVQLFSSYSLTL
jgi:hypothetical protein